MNKSKIHRFLFALLCLLISSAVYAEESFVHPTLTDDSEVCIFLLSPVDVTYHFYGEGGDYAGGTASPGDEFSKVGRQDDGLYLYKWTRPTAATGTPQKFTIYKNGTSESDIIYNAQSYVNHGVYIETSDASASGKTEVYQFGKVYATTNNTETSTLDPLAQLDAADEVSLFLESPDSTNYYLWPYRLDQVDGKDSVTYKGEYFTNKSWPGDKLNYVGKLANGHYLFKWLLNSHSSIAPNKFSICDNNSGTPTAIQGAKDEGLTNHGYYILTKENGTSHIRYDNVVTRRSDGSYSTNRTTYGKRVIYEMNVGSFTSEGTLASAKAKLNYLKNLGVDVIWLMPVYERGGSLNSPYAVKNYKVVKSSYGSIADLKDFVNSAHLLGMDVWLDFVANHTATDNAWVTSHPEYYKKVDDKMVHPASDGNYYSEGQTAPTGVTVYNDAYQLDYSTTVTSDDRTYNPATVAMEDAMKFWIDSTDIDGFRYDMVSSNSITNAFWSTVTKDLKAVKPSLQFLAEADFTSVKNVSASNFTYDYAWSFNEKLRGFGTGKTTLDWTDNDLTHITKSFIDGANSVNVDPMVYLINHDTNWGTATDGKYTMSDIWGDNRYAMTVYEFTMPGMPLIYNGQEQNGSVKLNYFEDTKINWSSTMDYKMLGLITELSQLKHTNNALNDGENSGQRGDTRILNSYENNGVFAYERIKGDQHVLVVLNLSDEEKSTTILGATQGTWKRVLSGNNKGIDNTYTNESIGEIWKPTGIPAHGFQVFTFTGEKHNYANGIYFVCDDNENNPLAHQMEYTAEDSTYNYYRFVINASDFDKLSTKAGNTTAEQRLSFRFQEYYDFFGTICKNDAMFGAGAAENDEFSVKGATKEYDFVRNDNGNTNPFYLVKGEEKDSVSKYIITFARSKTKTNTGKVTLQFVKEGEVLPGYYLITPDNVLSNVVSEVHKWRFKSKSEDEAAVSDRYLANLNEDKIDLCSFTINADAFDSFVPADRKAANTIQFRIRQTGYDTDGTIKDNSSDIDPAAEDADNDNSTFDASKDDAKVYEDCHWDQYTGENANKAFFKIVYQPDVSKYIIQMWRTSTANSGKTRVRVYYVRQYNYQGSTIEDVTASNEDCYLYNVDAQKFLYVGNNWGTMASLLYDDLGTRLNISAGKSDENPNYKLIRTRMENNTTVPDGHMLGIDDWSYDPNSQWPEDRLDNGFIYTDRDNGNRWIFQKADNISYANTYTLKLYDKRDDRFHYLIADHMDGESEEAKRANTRVKYVATPKEKVVRERKTAEELKNHAAYGNKQYVEMPDSRKLTYENLGWGRYVDGYGVMDEFMPGCAPDSKFKASFDKEQDSIDFETYNKWYLKYNTNANAATDSATYHINIRYICKEDKQVTLRVVDSLATPYPYSFMDMYYPVSCSDPGARTIFEQTMTAPATGSDTDPRTAKTLTFTVTLHNYYDPNKPWATRGYILLFGHKKEYQEEDEDENPLTDTQGKPIMNSYIDTDNQYDDIPHFVSYNITKANEPADELPDLKYARWQIVTYGDLVKKLKNENAELYGGATADATFLLKDQGFTRYIQNTWDTDNGVSDTSTVQMTKNAIGDFSDVGMYWNGHITGKGKVYQDVDVPMYGIYQFDAYGFYNGSPTQMFYQYATEFSDDGTGTVKTWSPVLGNTPLYNDKSQTYKDRTTDVATGEMLYKEAVLGDNPTHLNTQFLYVPQDAKQYNGNYRIRIGFNKTAEADGDYTAVDDVHLHYTGKSPFILDDNWTEESKNKALAADDRDVRENVPVWIKRKFWVNSWNTLVLPVSVSTTTLRAIFGDDVELAEPYGLDDDDPYLIRFNPVDLSSGSNAIVAGKYYIVKPKKLVGTSSVMKLERKGDNDFEPGFDTVDGDDAVTKFYNLGSHNLKDMPSRVDTLDINTFGFHAASEHHKTDHNTIKIIGSFCETHVPDSSYVFTSEGRMLHLKGEKDATMKGFRFYIVDVANSESDEPKSFTMGSLTADLDALLASFGKDNDEEKGKEPTSIDGVTDMSGNGNNNGNVYDISGRLVSTNGITDNLPSGIYIFNHKKYIKH